MIKLEPIYLKRQEKGIWYQQKYLYKDKIELS
jgi:hypothetical protein